MGEGPQSHPRDADRLIYAGLLGLAAAGVLELADHDRPDTPQLIGIYLFALAIPLLAVGIVTDYARRAGTRIPGWHDAIGLIGAVGAVAGLAALFFHFGVLVGTLFLAGCGVGFILVRRL